MALVSCNECNNQVSDKASTCPKCGAPVKTTVAKTEAPQVRPVASIIAMGAAIASLLTPYFAAVFLVPIALISSAIAYRQSQKIGAVIACIIGLFGMIGVFNTSEKIRSLTQATEVGNTQSTTYAPQTVITYASFSQLKEGMSILEADSIIGAPGEEISRTDIADYRTVMYGWKNPDGSNANAMFQNGSLISKSQFGLR